MISRHPHVFGDARPPEDIIGAWEEIKKAEKKDENKEEERRYLAEAFTESEGLIGKARERKEL